MQMQGVACLHAPSVGWVGCYRGIMEIVYAVGSTWLGRMYSLLDFDSS